MIYNNNNKSIFLSDEKKKKKINIYTSYIKFGALSFQNSFSFRSSSYQKRTADLKQNLLSFSIALV